MSDTTLTLGNSVETFDGVQDPARSELFLVKEFDQETSPILYYKYESLDPLQTDTRHDAKEAWAEQTTACPTIISGGDEYDALLKTDDGHEVNVDDGFILDWEGRAPRVVAIAQNGDVLDEAQARARETTSGVRLRRYTEWGFRLRRATKTDGPEQRFQLMETEKVQRDRAEGQMASRLEQVFSTVLEKIGGESGPPTKTGGPESAAELLEAFDKLTDDPRQAAAIRESLLADLETKAEPEEKTSEA